MSSTKRKAPPVRIARPQTTHNAKHMAKASINEARTSVVSVPKHQHKAAAQNKADGEAIEISSDESDDGAAEADDLMDEDEPMASVEEPQTNGHDGGEDGEDGEDGEGGEGGKNGDEDADEDADEDRDHEPTFGDLVREHETVDVAAALSELRPAETPADRKAGAASGAASASAAAAAPTLASLGHLLNAALRSGDDANLEVCFTTTTDAVWVRNTIQRLDPSLAGALLQKLAARIHRRPGRAHTLVGWVQWTLITHGGALLANQAGVTRALQELHRVLEERARGLNSLLLLKGKLDMLEAQMQMRRLQRQGGQGGQGGQAGQQNGPRATSGVATVGGRVGSTKAVDSVSHLGGRRARGAGRRRGGGVRRGVDGDGGDDDDEDLVTYNEGLDDDNDNDGAILVGAGVAGESFVADSDEEALDNDEADDSDADEDGEDEDEDDGDDDGDNLEEIDDAGDADEVDFDDVDDDDEEDDEDDEDEQAAAAPPPKLQKKAGGAFSKRR